MRIPLAHVRIQGVNCAVFMADARGRTLAGRDELLGRLVARARANGLLVDKAALAFPEHGRTKFYGTPDLTRYLARRGAPRPTHTLVA